MQSPVCPRRFIKAQSLVRTPLPQIYVKYTTASSSKSAKFCSLLCAVPVTAWQVGHDIMVLKGNALAVAVPPWKPRLLIPYPQDDMAF
jgi:hypothetical protein